MASDRGSATELEPAELEASWFDVRRPACLGLRAARRSRAASAAEHGGRARAGRRRRRSPSTSRPGASSTSAFASESRRIATGHRLRHRARAGRIRAARRPRGWSSAAPSALGWTAMDHPTLAAETSSTRPAPVTRSRPASSSAGSSSGSRQLLAAARSSGRCRDPHRRRRSRTRFAREAASSRSRRRSSRTGSRRARGSRSASPRSGQSATAAPFPPRSASSKARSSSGFAEDELARFDASARKAGPRDLAAAAVQGAVARDHGRRHARRMQGGRDPLHGDRGPRRRPPGLARSARRLGRPRRARRHAGARRLVGREVTPRRAGYRRAPRDPRRARARLAAPTTCRSSTRLTVARRSRRGSKAPPRRRASPRRTGSSAAAGSCSAARRTRASTTSSR